jgi:hypothetical protein
MPIFPDLGGYGQTTQKNPSQRGHNPAVPPIHRAAGVDGGGNGSKPPVFAPAPSSISADMGSKVKATVTMPNPFRPPARGGGFSDSR